LNRATDSLGSHPFKSSVDDHMATAAKALDVTRFIVAGVAVNMVAICGFLHAAPFALVKRITPFRSVALCIV